MSGNTLGDKTLAPFKSTNEGNFITAKGVVDLDWFTDLKGYSGGFEPVVYPIMKRVWTAVRWAGRWDVGTALPFQDPGEVTSFWESIDGGSYRGFFP
jgi:hypothetical protein